MKIEFSTALLSWYDRNARILPWRDDPLPYRVWVSEIMLQQTRVEAVKPFFERFMMALPELKDLAVAEEDTLHKLWEGLGYYNRVKNMKKAAMLCMTHYKGNLPDTYEELLKLPGIGSYSAGAIASIAYRRVVPAVDGNVLRVFSRVLESYDDILKESTKRKFQEIVLEYIPKDRPDAFNQAIMEIGAMVCVPNGEPKCSICPLKKFCLADQHNTVKQLPVKTPKKQRTIEHYRIDVVVYDKEVLLIQREEGLLSGLYGFWMFDEAEAEAYACKDLDINQIIPLREAKHIFTHKEWHMSGRIILLNKKCQGLWATSSQIKEQYAIPTAFKVYKEAYLQWIQED